MERGEATRGGLLLRVDGALFFIPAAVALAVAPLPAVARIPGAPTALLGLALHEGDAVPVLALGLAGAGGEFYGKARAPRDAPGSREALVICLYLGEKVGLVGGEVVGTGVYPAVPPGEGAREADQVLGPGGERARLLDLATLYSRVQGEGWAGRWRG